MPCDPVTPNQYPIVKVNTKNKTHHFHGILVLPLFYMNINIQEIIFLSVASMPCDPVTPNQYPIVNLKPKNKTHHFVLYFSASSILYEY